MLVGAGGGELIVGGDVLGPDVPLAVGGGLVGDTDRLLAVVVGRATERLDLKEGAV